MKLRKNEVKTMLEDIDKIALKYGWQMFDFQKNIFMARYKKGKMFINIYVSKMTVVTYLEHPIKGKGQLYRKNCDLNLIGQIFQNPRVHTKKGYFKKSINNKR